MGGKTLLYLYSGGSYTTICDCHNSQNNTLRKVNITVCKLHLNQKGGGREGGREKEELENDLKGEKNPVRVQISMRPQNKSRWIKLFLI